MKKNYKKGFAPMAPLWVVVFVIAFAIAFTKNAPVWVYIVIVVIAVPVVLYLQDRSDRNAKK